jgi:hypothetical protein
MSSGLTVTVHGKPVQLDECGWIQRRPCGCIVSAVVAVVEGGWVLATADQANQHLNPTKRDRDKISRAEIATELITMAYYRSDIGAKWECEQHAATKAVAS